MHETKLHTFNAWITLTYEDKHLPSRYYTGLIHPRTGQKIYSGTLYKPHVQQLMRKLRKTLVRIYQKSKQEPTKGTPPFPWNAEKLLFDINENEIPILRYYYGGEYGEKYGRPHYHACLFGVDFQDKKHTETTDTGFKLYESKTLAKLWPYGQHSIGELNWETAAYTARYIMKKITGQKQTKHYEKIDHDTGEIITILPEYNDMSRATAIGKQWYEKHSSDIYKKDESYIIVRGKKARVPRYYDKLYTHAAPDHMDHLKLQRIIEAKAFKKDQTPQRLATREKVHEAQTQSLKQKLE